MAPANVEVCLSSFILQQNGAFSFYDLSRVLTPTVVGKKGALSGLAEETTVLTFEESLTEDEFVGLKQYLASMDIGIIPSSVPIEDCVGRS